MDGEANEAKVGVPGDPRSDEPDTGPGARNRLLTLGAAAVMMVYAAGYDRTREVAQRLAEDDARPHVPNTPMAVHPVSVQSPQLASSTPAHPSPDTVTPRPVAERRPTSTGAAVVVDTARATTTEAPAAPAPAPTRTDAVVVAVAPAPTPAPAPAPAPADTASKADIAARLKDGTYSGWGTSRHGDIEAAVVIANGRIVSASITQCLTRYSCSWISPLPPQVVSRQSAEVDSVSGATQSSNAFYTAIFEALKLAK